MTATHFPAALACDPSLLLSPPPPPASDAASPSLVATDMGVSDRTGVVLGVALGVARGEANGVQRGVEKCGVRRRWARYGVAVPSKADAVSSSWETSGSALSRNINKTVRLANN